MSNSPDELLELGFLAGYPGYFHASPLVVVEVFCSNTNGVRLMAEILHHLGCIKPCICWMTYLLVQHFFHQYVVRKHPKNDEFGERLLLQSKDIYIDQEDRGGTTAMILGGLVVARDCLI